MVASNKAVLKCLGLCVLGAAAIWLRMLPQHSHPHDSSFEMQRATQRQLVEQRVQAAGGWATLAADCRALVTNCHTHFFQWPSANAAKESVQLPGSIAALEPREIEFDMATNAPTVVRVKIFGTGRSGRTDVPYYGLWLVATSASPDYVPPITEGPARVVSRITNEIFEAYQ